MFINNFKYILPGDEYLELYVVDERKINANKKNYYNELIYKWSAYVFKYIFYTGDDIIKKLLLFEQLMTGRQDNKYSVHHYTDINYPNNNKDVYKKFLWENVAQRIVAFFEEKYILDHAR